MSFVVGQRWISHADLDLGLGVVLSADERRVTLLFPAVEEERTYAARNAPLSRVAFRPDDTIRLADERELTVLSVQELRGLLIYLGADADGTEQAVTEQDLSAFVQLSGPRQRLESGQCDSGAAFALRYETLCHRDRLQRSPAAGLLGSRTSLLPHQVYIAHEVSARHAPRVLLADEVGLGKTIEAGMILHQQLHTGAAERVLILVPEPLLHQWLVEMLRRFNLHFALFDAERLAADASESSPFETEQLVLCAREWLEQDASAREAALAAPWDLVVVDEAHHLTWEPDGTSTGYQMVAALAARTAGLLLLTATPEQAGQASHFARLRLLDPARFHDYDAFCAEQQHYRALSELISHTLIDPVHPAANQPQPVDAAPAGDRTEPLDATTHAALRQWLGAEADALIESGNRAELVDRLLDRHGTGRVLFRNSRAAVAGFPERRLHPAPLPKPALYPATALFPEQGMAEEAWLAIDPRVTWLEQLLKQARPAKVLVICASATTATALEHHLHLRAGIRSAAFHEGLTIIERDRAAAWFAEPEQGAQALICSEIGSEGRNFQFASQLVLFDLPLNPDLLEQRIGRLDRIGQGEVVDIHAPYLEETAQAVLFRWFNDGLDSFCRSFAGGFALYERFADRLALHFAAPTEPLDTLVEDTAAAAHQLRAELAAGRDALLELHSCRPAVAERVIDQLQSADNHVLLQAYMHRVWDYFGVEHEFHSDAAEVVRPSDHQLVPDFPALPLDGTTITFDRAKALAREDMSFLSWEHPMVTGAMDLVEAAEHGNASVASISVKGLKPGTLLLEAIYTVQCSAPRRLRLERFLPLAPQRLLVDISGKSLGEVLPHERLNTLSGPLPRQTAQAAIKQLGKEIGQLLGHANRLADGAIPELLTAAERRIDAELGGEAARLRALRAVNKTIREDEIAWFETQREACRAALNSAALQLQGLRLIIST